MNQSLPQHLDANQKANPRLVQRTKHTYNVSLDNYPRFSCVGLISLLPMGDRNDDEFSIILELMRSICKDHNILKLLIEGKIN